MTSSGTVIDSKSAFLRTQIRLLTAVLEPSLQFRENVRASSDGPGQKTIDNVMEKVNGAIATHNRYVYTPETTRHVAGQIDALYWNEITARPAPGEADELMVEKDKDLTLSEAIATLPDTLDSLIPNTSSPSSPSSPSPDESTYQSLHARLQTLSRARDAQQHRLAQYKHLQKILQPLQNPQESIQPNLASKDGELARELERLRVLAARVGGRIREMGPPAEEEEEMDVGGRHGEEDDVMEGEEVERRKKLERVLDMT
ncbi:MAG: hypothetical protein Q9227_001498 [Pyrenula ochraceoflavens]